MASSLAPLGKLTIGAAVSAPWLDLINIPATIWSIWDGGDSTGRSMLARLAANLYGSPKDGEALFFTPGSAPQDIPARLREFSYLPVFLDEVQTLTGDVAALCTSIVTDTLPHHSSSQDAGSWCGVCFMTGNAPLADQLAPEMFYKRLIEIEADDHDLWNVPEKLGERDEFWRQVHGDMEALQGWPWAEMQRQFPPGPKAERYLDRLDDLPSFGPSPPARLLQLACRGCEWMAEWTGEQGWVDGVWEAAARLADQTEQRYRQDVVAAIAGSRIAEDHAHHYDRWHQVVNGRIAFGIEDHLESCRLPHDGECMWFDAGASALRELVEVPMARLLQTRFSQILVPGLSGADRDQFTRRRSGDLPVVVYRLCMSGAAQLALDGEGGPRSYPAPPTPGPPTRPRLSTEF